MDELRRRILIGLPLAVPTLTIAHAMPSSAGVAPVAGSSLRIGGAVALNTAPSEAPDHNSVKRTYVLATARDDYTVMFSWSELYNSSVGPGVFVLLHRDGRELPDTEGPLALISREDLKTGPRHVRCLKSIEVRRA